MADIIFRGFGSSVKKEVKAAIDVAMEAVAQQCEGNAIRETNTLIYETPPSPSYVRTGDLKKSIAHKYVSEEQAAYIGTALEYAPYVELGTRNMHERPFLRNAAQNYIDEYKGILTDALSNLK